MILASLLFAFLAGALHVFIFTMESLTWTRPATWKRDKDRRRVATVLPRYIYFSDIKKRNKALGHHWFDPDTMRFFDSRLLEGVHPAASNAGNRWESREGSQFAFVTSESKEWEGRKYTVRILTLASQRDDRPAVDISSLDDAYRLDTAAQARSAAKEWAATH